MSEDTNDDTKTPFWSKHKFDWPNVILGGFVGLLLTIAGGYFFSNLDPVSKPTYTIAEHVEVVSGYRDRTMDPVSVVDQQGEKIHSGVYRLVIIFWNRRKLAFDGSDYPRGVVVHFSELVGIIEQKIGKETGRDLSNFKIEVVLPDIYPDEEFTVVTFNTLMYDHGAAISIWYTADEMSRVWLDADSKSDTPLQEAIIKPRSPNSTDLVFFGLTILSVILGSNIVAYLVPPLNGAVSNAVKTKYYGMKILYSLAIISIGIAFIYYVVYFLFSEPSPPRWLLPETRVRPGFF